MTTLRLDKLNRVWDGIKSGELKHDQQNFFCRTKACFAGWLTAYEAMDGGAKLEDYNDVEDFAYSIGESLCGRDYFAFARDAIGLSHLEAQLLFEMEATVEIQQLVVNSLNAGQRFLAKTDPNETSYRRILEAAGLQFEAEDFEPEEGWMED